MDSTAIPASLVEKTFLADVPISLYGRERHVAAVPDKKRLFQKFFSQRQEPKKKQKNVIEYYAVSQISLNIGGWVSLPLGLRKPVSLCVIYTDRLGEHAILIDEMEARGASQVLLSGLVEIRATGMIQSIKLYCGGINDLRVWAEDLHIQKVDSHKVSAGNDSLSLAS